MGGGNKGFTLVEMLIVVAIIAILVAISIPLVNNALEKARHATDAANERSAKAAMVLEYMEGTMTFSDVSGTKLSGVYAYDAKTGKVVNTVPTGYGQHKGHAATGGTRQYIVMRISDAGVVTMNWSSDSASLPTTVTAGTLCSENGVSHS